ncbi:MAG: hypothetical protein K6U11_03910 [bacterium]|nr:hypothetical protein [bacterium]
MIGRRENLVEQQGIRRRSFLKAIGLSSVGLGFMGMGSWSFLAKQKRVGSDEIFDGSGVDWKTDEQGNKYFVPKNIRTDLVNERRIVMARFDGVWGKYPVREFDDDFHDWWLSEKLWYFDQLIAFVEGKTSELNIPNGGHHHPMISTYGKKFGGRGDSDFHLNTTAKGFTILPKPENIKRVSDELDKVYKIGNIPLDLFKLEQQLYREKWLWDRTRFATLELYTGRPINDRDPVKELGFTETHTFQNIIANPMATLTYMSLFNTDGTQSYFEGLPYLTPHFEFRGFCWLISYYNPDNTEYEKAVADYVNQAHSRFHGGVSDLTVNIFLIVEEFNNTPGYRAGLGKRVVPPAEYRESELAATTWPSGSKPKKKA